MSQARTNRKNISSIETFFDGLLRGANKLTTNLFFGEVPESVGKNWTDMVVVDCGNPLIDNDAYGRQTVLIYLYAKINTYGQKDVKTMQRLETKLNELIEGNTDQHYNVSFAGRYSNYSAINDVFVNTIQINLIIT